MTFQAIRDFDSKLDWSIDWTAWLASGETISTATWTQTGATVTLSSSGLDGTSKIATVTVDGGTEGSLTLLRCSIVTSAGREDSRTILLQNVRR